MKVVYSVDKLADFFNAVSNQHPGLIIDEKNLLEVVKPFKENFHSEKKKASVSKYEIEKVEIPIRTNKDPKKVLH